MANKLGTAISGAGSGATAGFQVGGPWGAAIGGAAGLLGGLFGGGESEEAKAAREAAELIKNEWKFLSPEDRQLVTEYYRELGQFTPEMEQAIALGASPFEQITTDPRLERAQMDALAAFEQRAKQGGFNLSDQAQMEEVRREIAGDERRRQEAILTSNAQRGMSGAGAELAAQLASSQSSADRAADMQLKAAAQAIRNKMEAQTSAANVASNIAQTQYGRQKDLASQRAGVEEFNVRSAQGVQQRNVGARNQAQESELDYKRKTANANTYLKNKAREDERAQREKAADAYNTYLKEQSTARTGAARTSDLSQATSSQGMLDAFEGIGTGLTKGAEMGWFGETAQKRVTPKKNNG